MAGHESYRIRPARSHELAQLQDIESAAAQLFSGLGLIDHMLDERLSLEHLRDALAGGRVWVAAAADESPVGFAVVTIADGEPHIEELDVHPDHGRRGVGARLVVAVCMWARNEGFARVSLCTFAQVPWNAPWYERLGFGRLHPAEWGDELLAKRRLEAERGFPMEHRVVMAKTL